MQKPTIYDRLQVSQNTHHLTSARIPDTATTRSGKEVVLDRGARHKLEKHRGLLHALQNLDLSPLENTVATWDDLQERSIEIFELHVRNHEHMLTEAQQESILHAGTAGAGASGAFLKVIPELVPADTTREVADNSLRTAMDWAALSEKADAGLTRTVADTVPSSKLPVREQYIGLSYNPEFFLVEYEPGPYIAVDYTKLQEYAADIDKGLGGRDIYFGCPFRRNIPRIYRKMAHTAAKSGLL